MQLFIQAFLGILSEFSEVLWCSWVFAGFWYSVRNCFKNDQSVSVGRVLGFGFLALIWYVVFVLYTLFSYVEMGWYFLFAHLQIPLWGILFRNAVPCMRGLAFCAGSLLFLWTSYSLYRGFVLPLPRIWPRLSQLFQRWALYYLRLKVESIRVDFHKEDMPLLALELLDELSNLFREREWLNRLNSLESVIQIQVISERISVIQSFYRALITYHKVISDSQFSDKQYRHLLNLADSLKQ